MVWILKYKYADCIQAEMGCCETETGPVRWAGDKLAKVFKVQEKAGNQWYMINQPSKN